MILTIPFFVSKTSQLLAEYHTEMLIVIIEMITYMGDILHMKSFFIIINKFQRIRYTHIVFELTCDKNYEFFVGIN